MWSHLDEIICSKCQLPTDTLSAHSDCPRWSWELWQQRSCPDIANCGTCRQMRSRRSRGAQTAHSVRQCMASQTLESFVWRECWLCPPSQKKNVRWFCEHICSQINCLEIFLGWVFEEILVEKTNPSNPDCKKKVRLFFFDGFQFLGQPSNFLNWHLWCFYADKYFDFLRFVSIVHYILWEFFFNANEEIK